MLPGCGLCFRIPQICGACTARTFGARADPVGESGIRNMLQRETCANVTAVQSVNLNLDIPRAAVPVRSKQTIFVPEPALEWAGADSASVMTASDAFAEETSSSDDLDAQAPENSRKKAKTKSSPTAGHATDGEIPKKHGENLGSRHACKISQRLMLSHLSSKQVRSIARQTYELCICHLAFLTLQMQKARTCLCGGFAETSCTCPPPSVRVYT